MTTYSVQKEIKSLATKGKKRKEIIQCLTQSAGGFSKARTVAELPNSLNQFYDLTRKNKIKDMQNELLEHIDMCNIQYGLPKAVFTGGSHGSRVKHFLPMIGDSRILKNFVKTS